MGLFDAFKKNNNQSTNTNGTGSLTLNKEESLNKLSLRKEAVNKICLEKKELTDLTARVAVVMDYSGSMSNMFRNGTVQSVLERLLPLALKFDDNGELDMWLFENNCTRINSVNINNYYNYIGNERILEKYRMGGTNYAPVMKDVIKKYIKEEPANIPTLVLFITDGDNFDKDATTKLMKECSDKPIFWQFVGLGSASSFGFLQKLDDLAGRVVDNADFFAVNNINNMSDDELYNKLLTEYPGWIKEVKAKNILK